MVRERLASLVRIAGTRSPDGGAVSVAAARWLADPLCSPRRRVNTRGSYSGTTRKASLPRKRYTEKSESRLNTVLMLWASAMATRLASASDMGTS